MRAKHKDEYDHDAAFRGDVDELAARVDLLSTMVREASGAVVVVRGEVASTRRDLDGKLEKDAKETARALTRVQDDIAKLRNVPGKTPKSAPEGRLADELSVLADRVRTLSGMVNENAGQLAAREGTLERLRDEVSGETARVQTALDEVKRELAALGVRVAAAAKQPPVTATLDPGVAGKLDALADRVTTLSETVRETAGGIVATNGAAGRANERVSEIEKQLEQRAQEAQTAHASLTREVGALAARLAATPTTDKLGTQVADAVQVLGERVETISGIVREMSGRVAAREELAAGFDARIVGLVGQVDALTMGVHAVQTAVEERVPADPAEIDEVVLERRLAPLHTTLASLVARVEDITAEAAVIDSDVTHALAERVGQVEVAQETLREELATAVGDADERAEGLAGRQDELTVRHDALAERHDAVEERQAQVEVEHTVLAERHDALAGAHGTLAESVAGVDERRAQLEVKHEVLAESHNALAARHDDIEHRQTAIEGIRQEAEELHSAVAERHIALEESHIEVLARQETLESMTAELAERLEVARAALVGRPGVFSESSVTLAHDLELVSAAASETPELPLGAAAPVLRRLAEKLERIDADRHAVAEHLAAAETTWEEERTALRARIEEITVSAVNAAPTEDAERLVHELTVRLGRLEREQESASEFASLAESWTVSLGTLAARVEYGLIKLGQATEPAADSDDAQELVDLAARVGAMERDRDTVLGEIARATETWASERVALHERVAELAARIVTGPMDMPTRKGTAEGELGDAGQELDRLRIALEGMRMRLAYHEKAVAQMGAGSVTTRLDEVTLRLDRLQQAIVAGGGADAVSGPLLGIDVDELLSRVERAERSAADQRKDMLGHLEKVAARMDWRMRRLETPDPSRVVA